MNASPLFDRVCGQKLFKKGHIEEETSWHPRTRPSSRPQNHNYPQYLTDHAHLPPPLIPPSFWRYHWQGCQARAAAPVPSWSTARHSWPRPPRHRTGTAAPPSPGYGGTGREHHKPCSWSLSDDWMGSWWWYYVILMSFNGDLMRITAMVIQWGFNLMAIQWWVKGCLAVRVHSSVRSRIPERNKIGRWFWHPSPKLMQTTHQLDS